MEVGAIEPGATAGAERPSSDCRGAASPAPGPRPPAANRQGARGAHGPRRLRGGRVADPCADDGAWRCRRRRGDGRGALRGDCDRGLRARERRQLPGGDRGHALAQRQGRGDGGPDLVPDRRSIRVAPSGSSASPAAPTGVPSSAAYPAGSGACSIHGRLAIAARALSSRRRRARERPTAGRRRSFRSSR